VGHPWHTITHTITFHSVKEGARKGSFRAERERRLFPLLGNGDEVLADDVAAEDGRRVSTERLVASKGIDTGESVEAELRWADICFKGRIFWETRMIIEG
jgi:hypothetical protein